MASELVVSSFNITYSKGGARVTIPVSQLAVDISGTVIAQGVLTSTTSATAISGLPGTPGYAFVRNLDATNFVQVGPDNTNWAVKLTPGRPWAWLPLYGTALYHKADTASCSLQFVIFSA